jgi:hypothetical protein
MAMAPTQTPSQMVVLAQTASAQVVVLAHVPEKWALVFR